MYKFRFNLGRGKNYLKWKVIGPSGEVYYLSPELYNIRLHNCTLKNRSKSANKIYNGSHKFICAWIECESIEFNDSEELISDFEKISYNPRINPYWVNGIGENIDGLFFEELTTNNNKIYEKVIINEVNHLKQYDYGKV